MHKNCLYTNLILTELIIHLVTFPQSPLAEILLKKAGVHLKLPDRSLFQVRILLVTHSTFLVY